MFEVLRRRGWESSAIGNFLELLKSHLLQNENEAPSGLLLHILDLYIIELAVVGAAELTADQNLTFIEPFCRKAAKTKNQTLFSAICKSFFSTIIDQAPFAVEDLMKEVKTAEVSDLDSRRESKEDEDKQEEDNRKSRAVSKDGAEKKINGSHLKTEEESDDELLHLEDSDTELPDEDVGPVLQFDYAALADKLFKLASRSSTPSHNRQKLYKVIKVLRDLSEGTFPQDEYAEEVSTDEDDDMFGSRKRMKRAARRNEEGKPAEKMRKADTGGKREALGTEPVDVPVKNEKMKKKKKKRTESHEGGADPKSLECLEDSVKQRPLQYSTLERPLETQLQHSVGRRLQAGSCTTGSKTQLRKEKGHFTSEPVVTEREEQQQTSAKSDTSSETPAPVLGKKTKGLKAEAETGLLPVSSEASGDRCPAALAEASAPTCAKNKKKHGKVEAKLGCDLPMNDVSITEVKPAGSDDASGDDLNPKLKKIPDTAVSAKKTHKKIQKIQEEQKVVTDTAVVRPGSTDGEIKSEVHHKKITKKKGKREVNTDQNKTNQTISDFLPAGECTPTPVKRKNNQKGEKMTDVSESPQLNAGKTQQMQKNTKTLNLAANQMNEVGDSSADPEQPLVEAEVIRSSEKAAKKRRRKKIPVEFEFEADDLEGTTGVRSITEAKCMTKKTKLNNDVSEPSTPQGLKTSNKKSISRLSGSDFITFQRKAAVPTPLYCKTMGSPSTNTSSTKRQLTPRSESKKVTFGLKNNKTAEFKKTDRSVLLSPDGLARVPFDPQQKPKFGVLKSPPNTVFSGYKKIPKSTKKTLNRSKKTRAKSLPNTPKRRPLAADFF
ncbi:hypothetical protein CHARACLAT_019313 [Characodon lateralis]|uniref:Uncharacterized protein n=1 Tax=Characodon lateralis TaxID=208331 RepID=A0ABU7CPP4_9TELE|nr:hypothetical protein [Characodon lateralis]